MKRRSRAKHELEQIVIKPRFMMVRKQIYSYALRDRVEAQLPQKVKDAMDICGWDALGVYEIVRDEIKRDRQEPNKAKKAL